MWPAMEADEGGSCTAGEVKDERGCGDGEQGEEGDDGNVSGWSWARLPSSRWSGQVLFAHYSPSLHARE